MPKPSHELTEMSLEMTGVSVIGTHHKTVVLPQDDEGETTNSDAVAAWVRAHRADRTDLVKLSQVEDSNRITGEAMWRNKAPIAGEPGQFKDARDALHWLVAQAGRAPLAAALADRGTHPAGIVPWDPAHRISVQLERTRSGGFFTKVVVKDGIGVEVFPTRDRIEVSNTFKGAIQQIAADIGQAPLATAISGM
jgi:hypothetical protein